MLHPKTAVVTASLLALGLPFQRSHADIIVDSADVNYTINQIKAGQFLSQATLGAQPSEIDDLALRIGQIGSTAAFNEWIDDQFAIPYQSLVGFADTTLANDGFDPQQITNTTNANGVTLKKSVTSYQQMMWWDRALRADDRLRQRTAWALIQIFVTSGNVDQGRLAARWRQPLSYYDVLLENSFTNYRYLIEGVTYHPFMGMYLSSLKNSKGDPANGVFPDENFAREILQLFSMGVYKLHQNGTYFLDSAGRPIENYDNDTIKEYAKVFTGLSYKPTSGAGSFYGNPRNYTGPMVIYEDYHDTSSKQLIGRTLPAGQTGDQDISDALDGIASNRNVAPHLARKLIQRFTSSNPSNGYVFRVAQAWNGAYNGGTRGEMKDIIRQILMDSEARNSLSITQEPAGNGKVLIRVSPVDAIHGKIKEPVLMHSQFLARYMPQSSEPGGVFKPNAMDGMTQQEVLRAPSVFNYYSTEYSPGNGPLYDEIAATGAELVSPEAELLPISTIPMFEGTLTIARNGYIPQGVTSISTDAVMTSLNNAKSIERDVSWLINDMNIYLCNGTMPQGLQDEIALIMEDDSLGDYDERFSRVMAIILSSADYAVSH